MRWASPFISEDVLIANVESKLLTGRFWIAGRPELVIPGTLDLAGNRPRLHLLGALSPFMEERPTGVPGVTAYEPAEDTGPKTILGAMIGTPGKVTLINATQIRLNAQAFLIDPSVPNSGIQEEQFRADYAVLGSHITDMDSHFTHYRFRTRNLEGWARYSGLKAEHDFAAKRFSFEYSPPPGISTALVGLGGNLELDSSGTISPPNAHFVRVREASWLQVSLSDGMTVRDAWQTFPLAASTFFTILFDQDSPAVAFELQDRATSRWCPIITPMLGEEPEINPGKVVEQPLFNRGVATLDRLAEWFDLARKMSPLPLLIAGVVKQNQRTLPNELLELISTAEGVHRRLYPGLRRLSEGEVREAAAALAESDVDANVRAILGSALTTYLWDVSLPQRLQQLAEDAANAVPGVTGKTNRWKPAVTNARNGFAHSLGGNTSSDDLYGQLTLKNSLRWLLTGRLLMEIGIDEQTLATAFKQYEPYQRFLRLARRDLPHIYYEPDSEA